MEPEDIEVILGSSISLSCTAEGFPIDISLQWQNEVMNTFMDLNGETNEKLVFNVADNEREGTYRCMASNSAGFTVSRESIIIGD